MSRRRVAALAAVTAAIAVTTPVALAQTGGQSSDPTAPAATYLVGGDAESIDPTAAMLDLSGNKDFFLGGYGFSSGRPLNTVDVPGASAAIGDRYATGILGDGRWGPDGDGVHSRAFSVSDGQHTIVLAQVETQGYFAAYKQGPFGLTAIRKDAAAQIAKDAAADRGPGNSGAHSRGLQLGAVPPPAPTASEIVVDSVHTHGGPDTVGVWGGVPTSYLKEVHDQTVLAIVKAWKKSVPATLSYGMVHAGVGGEAQYPPQECIDAHPDTHSCNGVPSADWLLSNQFGYDANNQDMDDELRVLQAKSPSDGSVIATYVNFSAHPTVLGSDNTKVTADYVGRLDGMIEAAYPGTFAMDQVATLGRTQPSDRGCQLSGYGSDADSQNLCALDSYASRVMKKVQMALQVAKPLTGAPVVAMNSYLLTDPATSPVLASIVYAGNVIGAPAGRAPNPPWYTGNLIGTTYFVGRIGHVLITGGPGEMYPQIWQKVYDTVITGDKSSGITDVMNIGTAGDFLGYIIAPLEAYPEPIYRSMASHDTTCDGVDDPVGVCPDPVGNDNYFFNISHTFGERLTCDLLRGAGDVLAGDAQKYWSTYDRCPAFANDLALPAGQDTQFPEQPDLSAVLTHM